MSTQIMWMILKKILESAIEIRNTIIVDMLKNKKLQKIETYLFIRGRKLNISFVFITQSYFAVLKNIKTKFYTLFYYENSKQTRASTNLI